MKSVGSRALASSHAQSLELLLALIKRDFLARYRGSLLGIGWAFAQPLLLLAVYTFVFSVAMRPGGDAHIDRKTYALFIFAGLLVFNFFAECFNRSPRLIWSEANYVKRVIFPLYILPMVSVGSALIQMFLGFIIWIAFFVVIKGVPFATWALFPVVFAPMVLIALGLSWFLACAGVYLRDVSQFTSVLTTVLMFLSPVFYALSNVPEAYRQWFLINPIAHEIELSRTVLLEGQSPSWSVFAILLLLGVLMCIGGFTFFHKLKRGFADVM